MDCSILREAVSYDIKHNSLLETEQYDEKLFEGDDAHELTEEERNKRIEEYEKEEEMFMKVSEILRQIQRQEQYKITEDIRTSDIHYVHDLIESNAIIPIEYKHKIFTTDYIKEHYNIIYYSYDDMFKEHIFMFNNLSFYVKETISDGDFYIHFSIPLILIDHLNKFVINDNGSIKNEILIQQLIYNIMLIDDYIDAVKIESKDKTFCVEIRRYNFNYVGPHMFPLHKAYFDFNITYDSFLKDKTQQKRIRAYIPIKSYDIIFNELVSKIGYYENILFFNIKEYLKNNIFDMYLCYESMIDSTSYDNVIKSKITDK